MTTSSPKSYNHLALRGAGVDDMEFVEEFGLDPAIAYTPEINGAMLNLVKEQNIAAGMSEPDAQKSMMAAARDMRELMAKNGMLPK